ncbi:sugar ABC transporter substrate-binding protein [Cellulomonas sp. C5510]|uniref:sugar ABC transporter substrate-binding protein n=1 Tax=Cellulomonas sp. C5510 TaxID=2871170 RepID=UPI001C970709|nr:sugar ABC transporter substrate-binding protein [Cellulomonas sp. C5510]QZN86210.1 sugar ABC transporter substrate-binding protein [Cellulomonas sp. C5510]
MAPAAALALPLALLATACGSGGGGESSGDPTQLTFWDGFTQYNTGGSPFEELIATCEDETGITIERTVSDNIYDKYTRAASTGDLPDLLILDNPNVAQFAETGILADNEAAGIDTSEMQPNIVASGVYEGKTYGAPFGSNTLALFYDVDAFAEAGLEPPTDWDSLTSAAQTLTDPATGRYGIAFSARPDQEGTFQFLPFFWGAGAELTDVGSPEAVEALTLWTDLVADGYASGENVTLNQQEIRDQFTAGHAAMMVNGTWQLNTLDDSDVNYAVVPIPAPDGGPAPSPLGGEFINVVQNEDPAIVTAAGEFASCFTSRENLAGWLEGQTYISPYADQAEQQAADDPRLVPWVEAVGAARSRTEDLGSSFASVATRLGEALSGAVAGQTDPATALADAAQ